jgi:hypothetical protein
MSRHHDYEARRHAGSAIARLASRVLREAGFKKAGPYRTFEAREPGYIATEQGNGTHEKPTAMVLYAGIVWHGEPPAPVCEEVEQWRKALEADGRFDVEVASQGGVLRLTRKEA